MNTAEYVCEHSETCKQRDCYYHTPHARSLSGYVIHNYSEVVCPITCIPVRLLDTEHAPPAISPGSDICDECPCNVTCEGPSTCSFYGDIQARLYAARSVHEGVHALCDRVLELESVVKQLVLQIKSLKS